MARPLRIEYEGAFYHIIQRGNERRDIFLSDEDRNKFYEYLKIIHDRYAINIHTYCLMNNHYHLVLETKHANLARTIHFLNTSYTVYFNAKQKRQGHLFQGRYKAVLVEADNYLHHLSRYIHLNPVRAKIVKDPLDYSHSSYRYFINRASIPKWLKITFILEMFDKNIEKAKVAYKEFVLDLFSDEGDVIKKNTTGGFLLGRQNFVEEIKEKFIQNKTDREIPVIDELKSCPAPDKIQQIVRKRLVDKKLSRTIEIYLLRKYTARTLKETASLYDKISDAGISALCNRMDKKRGRDRKLDKIIIEMEKLLKIET